MSDLSRKRDVDQIYTNHSIRATGATILSKEMYGPSQTMAVTGHKFIQSLTVYPGVDKEETIRMEHSNFEAILRSASKQLALPAPTIFGFPSSSQPSLLQALNHLQNRQLFLLHSQLIVRSILKTFAFINCLMTLSIQMQTCFTQLCKQIN